MWCCTQKLLVHTVLQYSLEYDTCPSASARGLCESGSSSQDGASRGAARMSRNVYLIFLVRFAVAASAPVQALVVLAQR